MMSKIDFQKQKIPFTQVANAVLNDPRLSLKAKGLYAYLYSKPDGWDFESRRIAKESTDGRDGVRSTIEELERTGYLKRYKLPTGRMVYKLIFPPMTENTSQAQKPMTEKANDGKTHSGKSRHLSNKEKEVINSVSNKYSDRGSQDIPEVIKEMEKIDPKNKMYYGNTTQRKAVKFMLDEYGKEQIFKAIEFYLWARRNRIRYLPTITTPHQLMDKWQNLLQLIERKDAEKQEELSNFIG